MEARRSALDWTWSRNRKELLRGVMMGNCRWIVTARTDVDPAGKMALCEKPGE